MSISDDIIHTLVNNTDLDDLQMVISRLDEIIKEVCLELNLKPLRVVEEDLGRNDDDWLIDNNPKN